MKSRPLSAMASLAKLAVAACSFLFAGPADAQNDRIIDTPTGWAYYYGATSAEVDAQIANGYRPISIDRGSSTSYDTIYVANSGAYQANGTVLRRAQTAAQMNSFVTTNNLRILDLEAYDSGSGTILYDALTISNTGATAAPGWAYQVFNSWQEVVNWQTANPTLRPIDIDSFAFNGGRKFSIVAVPNTGNNAQSWGWAFGQTYSQVNALLAQGSGFRLIDVDIEDASTSITTFNVIFVGDHPGLGKWSPFLSTDEVAALHNNNGARLTHLVRYTNYLGWTQFAAIVVDNSQPEERRIRDLMLDQMPSSDIGFARRRIGGSIERSLNAAYQFEPASCMKIVHGSYAVSRFAAGIGSFSSTAYCADNCLADANDCPLTSPDCSAGQNSLDNLIYYMFHDSNNNMTKAVEDYFGRSNLNNWVAGLGLNIHINHTLGCGGPPANEMSCADVTRLYELAFGGSLFNQTWENALRDHMIHGTGQTDPNIAQIVDQEAASTNLTIYEIAYFKEALEYAFKGGSYHYGGAYHRGNAGYVHIPIRGALNGNVITAYNDYSVAMFVNNSQSDSQSNQVYALFYELLREPIHNALLTWDSICTVPPIITQDPEDASAVGGTSVSFSMSVAGTNVGRVFHWTYSPTGYGAFMNVADEAGHISGATTTTLTFTNVQAADAGFYRANITTPCGFDQSPAVQLTVSGQCIQPIVLIQPDAQTVTSGEDAVFSTLVTGSSLGRTYLWQRLAPGGIIWTSLSGTIGYSGATTNTLTVLNAADADEGQFRCHITNACGSANTDGALLTVQPSCVAPTITRNPASAHVTAGADVVLRIHSSGSISGRTFQWQRRPGTFGLWSNLAEGHGQTLGTTTDTLTLLEVNEADEANYRCVVTNSCGTANSTAAVLTVDPACGSADYNCDGDIGTDSDIAAFFACLSGACPASPCTSTADFNGDGDLGTDADIESFFRVLGGGSC